VAYANKIFTSLFGRRLGLQNMSTTESGGSRGFQEYLVGPEELRVGVTTAETTSTNLNPHGISRLPGTSAASSAVYTIDPPVPGVRKLVMGTTDNGPVYLKTVNNETIVTTAGSSFTTVKVSSVGGVFELVGLTTAIWLGLNLTTGTSSQASGFGLTTST
jgi:hypothetical protein